MIDLRPRVEQAPCGLLDVIDRHLTSATVCDEAMRRYIKLMRVARNSAVLGITAALALWTLGILAVIHIAGSSPWAAGGLGVAGPTAASWVGWRRLRRRLGPASDAGTDTPTRSRRANARL